MKVFYSDQFVIPLPPGHRFPMQKYARLRQRVLEAGFLPAEAWCVPHAATDDELALAHDREYIRRVTAGELTPQEIRRIGLPWSPGLVERARRSCGASIEACQSVLAEPDPERPAVAVNLAGGTHHAFRDRGEGYCVFNDAAVAARAVQATGLCRQVLIIDCDVHQGNGTAAILAGDPTIFTFSIHGAKNFPFHKETSDLDVELPDGADDSMYLQELAGGLERIGNTEAGARAELAIYLAGADPFLGDGFGRLKVSKAGLAERDRMVLDYCRRAGLPAAITMAGGYARQVEDTVDIHFQTVWLAYELTRPAAG